MTILRTAWPVGLLAAAAAIAACSSSSGGTQASSAGGGGGMQGSTTATGTGGNGGAGTGGGPFMTAAHPAQPQVVDLGGPTLAMPKVQPIAYASDTGLSDIEAMLQELTKTSYWSDTTSEYGVGPLTVLPTITLTTTPPAMTDDATLQSMIAANTTGAAPAWGPADPSTIYLFVMPQGSIVDSQGLCCQDFDGYHDEATSGSTEVAYAVSCACPGFDGPSISLANQRAVNISHELVEAATDPFPNDNSAYGQEDDDNLVWTLVSGGEVADMCEFNDDTYVLPQGGTYTVQRSWSNARAKKNENPCVPRDPTEVYFNSMPALDTVPWAPPGNGTFMTKGVQIPVGQSKTIDVNLFSTAPMPGPWKVSVYDYDYLTTGGAAKLGLSLDKSTGQNGDTLHLTITVKSADAMINGEAFVIYSDYGKPGDADFQSNLAMGLVVN